MIWIKHAATIYPNGMKTNVTLCKPFPVKLIDYKRLRLFRQEWWCSWKKKKKTGLFNKKYLTYLRRNITLLPMQLYNKLFMLFLDLSSWHPCMRDDHHMNHFREIVMMALSVLQMKRTMECFMCCQQRTRQPWRGKVVNFRTSTHILKSKRHFFDMKYMQKP